MLLALEINIAPKIKFWSIKDFEVKKLGRNNNYHSSLFLHDILNLETY